MSGVRIYSIYLNNMVKDIDGYSLTKNLSSSEISIGDLSEVAKDLDDMVYLSDTLVLGGEPSLVKSYKFLNSELPIDLKGIILSDMGVNIVSKDVLKYCGSLLESNKSIDTKALGRLFKDISEGLTSVNALSEQLLGDVYSTNTNDYDEDEEYDEEDEEDYDLDEDLNGAIETYGINSNNISDDNSKMDMSKELEYNDYYSEQSILEDKNKMNYSSFDSDYEDGMATNSIHNNSYEDKGYSIDNVNIESDDIDSFDDLEYDNNENTVLNDELSVSYNSNGTINDKLAYAITMASSKIVKTPNKLKTGSKTVYSNMVDFDS